ncbi:MAG: hypothetical protein ACYC9J_03785 [Sulfuricaulis sp.]
MSTNQTGTIKITLALAISTLVAVLPMTASADHDDNRGWHGGDHREWHGGDHREWHGDIRHFDDHDMARWRGGHWDHDYHDGRLGWWWIVGGLWYFYPQWVSGYPDPYTPPPTVIVQPAAPVEQSAPPPTQYWYYCDAAKAYYPYVQSCARGWRMVPASPAGAPAQ